MMKIKNKQFFNRKILMTLVVGTNVILGGTAVYAEEPQKFTLDEYVVTATRTELSRKEVPQSVEVITKEDIQNIGATNVIDALRTATNIEIPEAGKMMFWFCLTGVVFPAKGMARFLLIPMCCHG